MAMCPDCTKYMNKINFNDIMHNDETRDLFFTSAKLVLCNNCNKNFYKTDLPQVTITYNISGVVGTFKRNLDVSVSKNKFQELKSKYFKTSGELISYLPDNIELIERYEDLIKSFKNNDSERLKLFNIRSVIEAYLVYTNDIETAHNLHKQVDKLNAKHNLKNAFKHIIKQCVNAIHVKKELVEIDPHKAFQLIDIIFTQEYKIPQEKLKLEEKGQELDKELELLINNF